MRFASPPAPILLIGGSPDGVLPVDFLALFATLSGGKTGHIAVITSGSRIPFAIGTRYGEFFAPLCASVRIYHLLDRATAGTPDFVEDLARASGVFFSGGEQLLTTTRLAGTPALDIIRERHAAGAALGGTSAGASVMSGTMIAFGQDGEAPRHASLAMAPGLGFLPGMVVDQHFTERGRMGRLTTAVLYNPEQLGVGIDESTAALIRPPGTLEVMGPGKVTIIDGSAIEHTDAADVEPLDQPLTVTGLRVHALTAGQGFDLQARMVMS